MCSSVWYTTFYYCIMIIVENLVEFLDVFALEYIKNIENKETINHKDHNKLNNNIILNIIQHLISICF